MRWELATPSEATRDSAVKAAVPFRLPTLDGAGVDAGELFGKRPVVLVFWASWCAPCLEEAPHLERLFREHSSNGVAFVAVSIDAQEDHASLRDVVKRLGLTYPVALDVDGAVLAKYAVAGGIPLTIVFDARGSVVYRHQNYKAGDERELARVLAGLKADYTGSTARQGVSE